MGKDTVVQVILRLRDEMGAQAKKALDAVAQATGGVAKGVETAGRAASKLGAVRDATGRLQSAARDATGQLQAAGRAAGAIRGERINAAAQATARLGREARTSRRELDEAAKAGGRLAAALAKAGSAGKAAWGVARGVGQAGAGVAAGVTAGAAVAGHALAKPISYESKLAGMANVAFNERNAAGRIAGMKELDAAVKKGTAAGGGTRDEVAETLNAMLAQGMEYGTAMRLLPQISKAATASKSDPKDLANIALKGMQQGFFTEAQAMDALEKVVKGGELGQFEANSMGKWMPQLMSAAAGMKNMAGFEKLIASLQGIAVVTGSNDQTGNALSNLLGKITSQDTEIDFAKQGINLKKSLALNVSKGMDPLTAFVEITEREILSKDKDYQAVKKKIAAAKNNDEKKALLEQAAEILQKGALGKVLQDREAGLAFAGISSQKARIADVLAGMKNSKGSIDTGFAVASHTTEFKQQQLANEKDAAMSSTLENISPALNSVMDAATNLAREFPGVATVAMAAATAIKTMAAAAAGTGAMLLLTGGGAGAAAAGGGVVASMANAAKGTASLATRAAPWLMGANAAWDIYSTEKNDTLTRAQKNIAHSETYGSTAGALAGAAGGAALGSVVPVIGTAIGGLLGGILGWLAGGMAGKKAGNMAFGGPSGETVQGAQQLIQPREDVIKVDAALTLDGREIARYVNEYNRADSLRD